MDWSRPLGKSEGGKSKRRAGEPDQQGSTAMRAGAVRPLAAMLPRIAKSALGQRGFAENGIITDWPAIVGPTLAARSTPVKLTFPAGRRQDATLVVRVGGSLALELQHLEPLILERLNSYFGYRAIGRLKILQGPTPAALDHRDPPPPLDPAEEAEVAREVATIPDERLREALAGLGRAVRQDRKVGGRR